jgi:hypothetical protein
MIRCEMSLSRQQTVIARQLTKIAELERSGLNSDVPRSLLSTFEDCQVIAGAQRDQLRRDLAHIPWP